MVTQIEAAEGRKIRLYHKIIVLPGNHPAFAASLPCPLVSDDAVLNHLLRLIINI